MKLKDLKERALITADEEGNEIEYNTQLIEAINKVQNKLVVFARNKIKYVNITAVEGTIELPEDCFELMEVKCGLTLANYVKINNNKIKVADDNTYTLKYKAFLPNVTESTLDDFEIEIDSIAETCLVVGVASWIAIDNPELYDVLVAEYNTLLANLSELSETVSENTNGMVERVGGWYW